MSSSDYERRAQVAEKAIADLMKRIQVLENGKPSISSTSKQSAPQEDLQKALARIAQLEAENFSLKNSLKSQSLNTSFPITSSHLLSSRVPIINIIRSEKKGEEFVGQTLTVAGWAKTIRKQGGGNFLFVALYDGSCFGHIQVVVDKSIPGHDDVAGPNSGTGACIRATGTIVSSPGENQSVEMKATEVELLGPCVPAAFPLAKKKQTLEYLRSIAHLRARTNTIGAVARIRNSCAFATHEFFNKNGYFYVHTPLITASDCEGAGEMFQVTSLLKGGEAKKEEIPWTKDGKVDCSKDFFGRPSFLTVSGQLNGEMYATSIGKIYTFGPTFRAENAQGPRHLNEFWMIEPEISFASLEDAMDVAEAYVKYVIKYILVHNFDDLKFFEDMYEKGLLERLKNVSDNTFARVTYTDGIAILQKAIKDGKKFEFPVGWGIDLQTEHEKYLAAEHFKKPVFVTDYPKEIKAFYMKVNEDGKTVRATDLLVPKIGELIGGSQREEREDVLIKRIVDCGLDKEVYSPYLDLRRFGTVMHSGFGLGFERLIMFVTGLENIRDVIPFPRSPHHCLF